MTRRPRVEEILERQAKSWELRRRLAGEGGRLARHALAHLREGPWVTVSRQMGSGGLQLAEAVGRELGWQVYDRAILKAIAESTDSRETVLSRFDARALTPINDYVAHLLVPGDPGQLAYLRELTRVVWGLAKQGNAVIVGRGANWFLDARYGLRLRAVAPLEQRIRRLAEEERIAPAAARERIERHDRDRREYIREFHRHDIDDPLGYDLVVNLGDIDVGTATEIALAALRHKLGS